MIIPALAGLAAIIAIIYIEHRHDAEFKAKIERMENEKDR